MGDEREGEVINSAPNVTALFIGSGKVENKSLSDLTCAGTILGNEGDMYC